MVLFVPLCLAHSAYEVQFRYDLNCSELVKVVIEGKCHFDSEFFHHDSACAVSKAPGLIMKLLKCLPRTRQIITGDFVYLGKIVLKEARA